MKFFLLSRSFLLLLVLCGSEMIFAQKKADSLTNLLKSAKDTARVNVLNSLANELSNQDPEMLLKYSNEALALAKKLSFRKGEANATHLIGLYQKRKNDYNKALEYYQKALSIRLEIEDSTGIARSYNNIGDIYYDWSKYQEALEYYAKAQKLKELLKEHKGNAVSLAKIGNIYMQWGKYEDALKSYQKAQTIFEKLGDKPGLSMILNNIGLIYDNMAGGKDTFKLNKAKEYYMQALAINKEGKNNKEIAKAYNNLGNVYSQIWLNYKESVEKKSGMGAALKEYYDKVAKRYLDKSIESYKKSLDYALAAGDKQGEASALTNTGGAYVNREDYEQATVYLEKAIKIFEQLENKEQISIVTNYLGMLYKNLKQYDKALLYAAKSNSIAKEIKVKRLVMSSYELYAGIFDSLGNYKKALDNYKLFTSLKDSLSSDDNVKIIEELNTKYQTDKKEQEIKLLNTDKALQDSQIKQQQLLIWVFIVGLVLIAAFSVVVFNQYRQKKKANHELQLKNELITKQKQEITDSIVYARRIQTAILPPGDYILENLPERFILFKPRDIVSGDFYWLKHIDQTNTIIATAADCTGHGVPGAMMSMLGVAFLNEIVSKSEVHHANDVLNFLRDNIIKSLHQTGRLGEAQDGMDISLVMLHLDTRKLEFAGANNPLYLIRNGELNEIKGDKMPIGIHVRTEESFTNHELQLEKDDRLYLFSDGYVSQFGGPKSKKYMYKPFKEFLTKIHLEPMEVQQQMLDEEILRWQGPQEQVDDIIVMGIKIT